MLLYVQVWHNALKHSCSRDLLLRRWQVHLLHSLGPAYNEEIDAKKTAHCGENAMNHVWPI